MNMHKFGHLVLRLTKLVEKWRVAPMAYCSNALEDAGDGGATLASATLVAELKNGEEIAL